MNNNLKTICFLFGTSALTACSSSHDNNASTATIQQGTSITTEDKNSDCSVTQVDYYTFATTCENSDNLPSKVIRSGKAFIGEESPSGIQTDRFNTLTIEGYGYVTAVELEQALNGSGDIILLNSNKSKNGKTHDCHTISTDSIILGNGSQGSTDINWDAKNEFGFSDTSSTPSITTKNNQAIITNIQINSLDTFQALSASPESNYTFRIDGDNDVNITPDSLSGSTADKTDFGVVNLQAGFNAEKYGAVETEFSFTLPDGITAPLILEGSEGSILEADGQRITLTTSGNQLAKDYLMFIEYHPEIIGSDLTDKKISLEISAFDEDGNSVYTEFVTDAINFNFADISDDAEKQPFIKEATAAPVCLIVKNQL